MTNETRQSFPDSGLIQHEVSDYIHPRERGSFNQLVKSFTTVIYQLNTSISCIPIIPITYQLAINQPLKLVMLPGSNPS